MIEMGRIHSDDVLSNDEKCHSHWPLLYARASMLSKRSGVLLELTTQSWWLCQYIKRPTVFLGRVQNLIIIY
jgi:hypothetical protein